MTLQIPHMHHIRKSKSTGHSYSAIQQLMEEAWYNFMNAKTDDERRYHSGNIRAYAGQLGLVGYKMDKNPISPERDLRKSAIGYYYAKIIGDEYEMLHHAVMIIISSGITGKHHIRIG